MTSGHLNPGLIPEDLNPSGHKNLIDVFLATCAHYADQPAFTCMGETLTYGQLEELSAAFACYLQQSTRLQPGDRIAIQLPNVLQYPVALFGALRAGLVVVNTNPLYTPREMRHQFSDSGAKALLIYQCMAHNAEKVLADTSIEYVLLTQLGDLHATPKRQLLNFVVKHIKKMETPFNIPGALSFREVLGRYKGQQPTPVEVESQDIAVLQYTGGTTGVAKGAMLTHANLVSNTLQSLEAISVAGKTWPNEVISPLPLYHIYAFTIAQCVMGCGGHSILIPNPRDIPGFIKELKKWHPTTFLGLNTLFVALCRQDEFRKVDFSQLVLTSSGGMALTHDAAEQWEAITACPVVEGYGLTETSPVVSFNRPGSHQIGTIGQAISHTDVKIIDSLGEQVEEGEAGELCVRGPQVMAGYWQREDATQACMTEDGYFRTGDIALMQPDGYLKIVDRAKDMIIVSGFNVYPSEVEDVAVSHPDIVECAAIGSPDPVTGEMVKLFVVANNEELTEAAVRAFCKLELTSYKVPKHVDFVEELPKSNVGKVLRRMLRRPEDSGEV